MGRRAAGHAGRNAPSGGTDDFGLYDGAAQPTASRDLFASLYAFQSPIVPDYCP